jgi:hypothetical protein
MRAFYVPIVQVNEIKCVLLISVGLHNKEESEEGFNVSKNLGHNNEERGVLGCLLDLELVT